jgi:hypothetical protein
VTRKLLKKDRRNILITWKKYREWHWKELKKFLYLGSEKMFILWEQDLAGNKRIGKKASGTENVVMSSRNMVIGEQEINYWKLWIWFLKKGKYLATLWKPLHKECEKSECSNYSMVIITLYYSMVLYDNCSVAWDL